MKTIEVDTRSEGQQTTANLLSYYGKTVSEVATVEVEKPS